MLGSICDISWDIYTVSFRKIGFDTKRMSIFWALRNTSTSFMSWVSPFVFYAAMLLISSACLDKIVSNLVKDSCIILISVCSCVMFAVIVGVSILFLVAWTYVIFCGAAGLSLSCLCVFVI
jgi:hypothetical protein